MRLNTILSCRTGPPEDLTRFVLCLILAYPMALVLSIALPAPVIAKGEKDGAASSDRNGFIVTLRHLYSGLGGTWLAYEFMGSGTVHLLASSAAVYLAVALVPRRRAHWAAAAVAMTYMIVVHAYCQFNGYLKYMLDSSGPQMMLTIKLVTFGFDYRDGDPEPGERLSEHQRRMRLKTSPGPLAFFGYTMCFCGSLSGPAVNMSEYLAWINGSLFSDAPGSAQPILGAILPGLQRTCQAVMCAALYHLSTIYVPLSFVYAAEFRTRSMAVRVLYVWAACGLTRLGYYFAFKLSEGSCVWAGLGYSRWDAHAGTAVWTRAENVRIMEIELAQNVHGVTANWNIRTSDWLKNYVARRVPKQWSVLLTTLASAIWHGFYPGYYLSFLTLFMLVTVARAARRRIRPWFIRYEATDVKTADGQTVYRETFIRPAKDIYDIVTTVATSAMINYGFLAFKLMGWQRSVFAWSSVNYWGHAACAAAYVALRLPLPCWKSPPRAIERRKRKKE